MHSRKIWEYIIQTKEFSFSHSPCAPVSRLLSDPHSWLPSIAMWHKMLHVDPACNRLQLEHKLSQPDAGLGCANMEERLWAVALILVLLKTK